ncbi:MAG: hypothetical protein FJX54_12825 [Alphaproteobacteria bacterium]|nr:hypothetical protein [Alphaproteobacteria bacterium]
MIKKICMTTTVFLLLGSVPALAAPAAIVEDLTGQVAGIEVLDYVDAGRVIELRQGTLVLGYLKSCVRETIRGGTVKVGSERSEVTGGAVERKTSPCDGGKLQLTAEQAGKSGAMVFRRPPGQQAPAVPAASVTLHATSPVVTSTAAGTVVIERLDKPAPPISVALKAAKADLATMGVRLEPSGTYRATQGQRSVVFKIDAGAAAGGGPVIGRLLPL